MRAVFIENGISIGESQAPGISGGDVIIMEIARHWRERGLSVDFITTDAGEKLGRALNIDASFHVSRAHSGTSPASYAATAWHNLVSLPPELIRGPVDVIVTSNEQVYNVIPGYKLWRVHHRRAIWVSILHFVPRQPWIPTMRAATKSYVFYLSHVIGVEMIRRWSDSCFAISEPTARDYVQKMHYPRSKVHAIPAGVDVSVAREVLASGQPKEYDGLFLGSLRPAKGIFDLVPIWAEVIKRVPSARLAIAGTGTADVIRSLRQRIAQAHLKGYINLVGPIYDARLKYELIAKSRVLLLPSHEENWAMVVGEALASEVPVVVYDLKRLREVWGPYLRYVPVGDTKGLAKEVVALLEHRPSEHDVDVKAAAEFVSAFDWAKIADDILHILAARFPSCGSFERT